MPIGKNIWDKREGNTMQYTAEIVIDDDRWAKHPYGIWIKDENGNVVEWDNGLDSRAACYRISDKYGISHSNIKEVFC